MHYPSAVHVVVVACERIDLSSSLTCPFICAAYVFFDNEVIETWHFSAATNIDVDEWDKLSN